jgi:hypothetical protein
MNAKEKDQSWSCVRDNPKCILHVEGGQACVNAMGAGSCKRRIHGDRSDLVMIFFKKRLAAAAATA